MKFAANIKVRSHCQYRRVSAHHNYNLKRWRSRSGIVSSTEKS